MAVKRNINFVILPLAIKMINYYLIMILGGLL